MRGSRGRVSRSQAESPGVQTVWDWKSSVGLEILQTGQGSGEPLQKEPIFITGPLSHNVKPNWQSLWWSPMLQEYLPNSLSLSLICLQKPKQRLIFKVMPCPNC